MQALKPVGGNEVDVSIDLTYDEIVVLTRVMSVDMPVGVAIDDIEYPEAIRSRLDGNATLSLEARRILTPSASGPEVNPAVAELLDLASAPGLIISIEVEEPSGTDFRVLVCDEDLGVEVAPITPSAYRLTPFVTRDLVRRVVRFTDLRPANVPVVRDVTIKSSELTRAASIADVDQDGAADYLKTLGVDDADALASALGERRRVVSVTALHQPTGAMIEGGSISWIDAGLRGNWLSEPADGSTHLDTDDEDGLVLVRPVTAETIMTELVSYLPAAFSEGQN